MLELGWDGVSGESSVVGHPLSATTEQPIKKILNLIKKNGNQFLFAR
jgi:hypothetical protein